MIVLAGSVRVDVTCGSVNVFVTLEIIVEAWITSVDVIVSAESVIVPANGWTAWSADVSRFEE